MKFLLKKHAITYKKTLNAIRRLILKDLASMNFKKIIIRHITFENGHIFNFVIDFRMKTSNQGGYIG